MSTTEHVFLPTVILEEEDGKYEIEVDWFEAFDDSFASETGDKITESVDYATAIKYLDNYINLIRVTMDRIRDRDTSMMAQANAAMALADLIEPFFCEPKWIVKALADGEEGPDAQIIQFPLGRVNSE